MEEATHFAIGLIAAECIVRLYHCPRVPNLSLDSFSPTVIFFSSYVLCVLTIVADIRNSKFAQSKTLRSFITVLHACDGIVALMLGCGLWYQSNSLLLLGMICITKAFLLHLLSRMVTGVKAFSTQAVILQTTKTFIHHTSSFYFISNPTIAVLTGLWRFVSMNGHAALTLKDSLSPKFYSQLMWAITHMRNLAMILVLCLCIVSPEIRRGFALSATGHVAYMIVRLGPVFRIASVYFPDSADRDRWSSLTDMHRLVELFQGKHLWLSLELGLLCLTSIVFMMLRMSTVADFDPISCIYM